MKIEASATPSELISRMESPRTVLKTLLPSRGQGKQRALRSYSSQTSTSPEVKTKVPTHRPCRKKLTTLSLPNFHKKAGRTSSAHKGTRPPQVAQWPRNRSPPRKVFDGKG